MPSVATPIRAWGGVPLWHEWKSLGRGSGAVQLDLRPIALARLEPDRVQRAGVGEALIAVQVAAVERVEQVGPPVRVGSVAVGLELQVQRVGQALQLERAL
jgi:hypothetical protein